MSFLLIGKNMQPIDVGQRGFIFNNLDCGGLKFESPKEKEIKVGAAKFTEL